MAFSYGFYNAVDHDRRYDAVQMSQIFDGIISDVVYATYKKAMRHCDGYSMAYEWQRENQKIVEEATRPETIAAFVETAAAADVLLAKIGTSYDGDPVVLTQIAAVTQFVMCPKRPKSPELRSLWVAALERTRAASDDGYVKTFCDQQLRLCK